MSRPVPNLTVQYNPYLPGVLQSTGYYPDNWDPRSFQSWPPSFAYSVTQQPTFPAIPSGQQTPTPLYVSPPLPDTGDSTAQPEGDPPQTEQEYPLHRRNAIRANPGTLAHIERAREAKIRSLRRQYGDIMGHQIEYWGT